MKFILQPKLNQQELDAFWAKCREWEASPEAVQFRRTLEREMKEMAAMTDDEINKAAEAFQQKRGLNLLAELNAEKDANESRMRIIEQLRTERQELIEENDKLRASLHNRDAALESYHSTDLEDES